MRKIEKEMNSAIANGVNWKQDNTAVVNADGISFVLLYGKKIAEIGEGWIRLFDGGYQTATTKSRLNAILEENGLPGEKVFQKAHKWFVNYQGAPIYFFSGMMLY